MKTCPSCHKTYQDDSMRFCLDDGTALSGEGERAVDSEATLVMPEPRITDPGPTLTNVPPTVAAEPTFPPVNQRAAVTPGYSATPRRGSALPWVIVAVAVVLGVSGIVIALIVTQTLKRGAIAQPGPPSSPTKTESTPAAPESSNDTSVPAAGTAESSPSPRQTNKAIEQASPTPNQKAAGSVTPEPTKSEKPTVPRGPIAGGVLNGKAISLPKPAYPPIAKAAHVSGTVTVQVLIDESGNVVSAHATSGHPLLQASAVSAARGAKFSPTKLSGQPVKVTGVITYNFVAQ